MDVSVCKVFVQAQVCTEEGRGSQWVSSSRILYLTKKKNLGVGDLVLW